MMEDSISENSEKSVKICKTMEKSYVPKSKNRLYNRSNRVSSIAYNTFLESKIEFVPKLSLPAVLK